METEFANVASLLAEPVRAKILWTLLDGRAYTATELALFAGASPQTTSMHLGKLLKANFLKVESQGRHRYFRFSRDEVAYAVEAMANLIRPNDRSALAGTISYTPVKYCRSCYDHLAGKIGVLVTEALLNKDHIRSSAAGFVICDTGEHFFEELEIDISALKSKKRILAKPCLDWSERRPHLAGSIGAALLDTFLQYDWVRRTENSRALVVTSKGKLNLYEKFSIDIPARD